MTFFLRITGNYADEFDVMGIHEISDAQARFLADTEGAVFQNKKEICFGSNEEVELSELDVDMDHLTDKELEVVKRALGVRSNHELVYGLIDLRDVISEAMDEQA